VDIPVEKCANCGRVIGKLETPMVWRDNVVCAVCHAKLSAVPVQSSQQARPTAQIPERRQARHSFWNSKVTLGILLAGFALVWYFFDRMPHSESALSPSPIAAPQATVPVLRPPTTCLWNRPFPATAIFEAYHANELAIGSW
jgi:hypothetical protein